MNTLNTGFTDDSNDDLYHLALNVAHNVGEIPIFTPLAALLPPITAAAGNLFTAMGLPPGPVRETSIAAARGVLIPLLQGLAQACMDTPNVTEADLAATGFELRHKATHSSLPPDAPKSLRLKTTGITGELMILLAAVLRAVMYEVEYTLDPVNGPWVSVPSYNSTRGMKLTGLTRGKDYYVRVRAVASGQNRGPWSDLASAMVI